jgi:hypothetical protein
LSEVFDVDRDDHLAKPGHEVGRHVLQDRLVAPVDPGQPSCTRRRALGGGHERREDRQRHRLDALVALQLDGDVVDRLRDVGGHGVALARALDASAVRLDSGACGRHPGRETSSALRHQVFGL